LNECAQAFYEIGRKVTSLPAVSLPFCFTWHSHAIQLTLSLLSQTAQVAAQQGTYLGKKFSSLSKHLKALEANEMPDQPDEAYAKPFSYNHLGSLAYVGNS
jgi:NADH dehydrogenase